MTSRLLALLCVGASFAFRPTTALNWAIPGVGLLLNSCDRYRVLRDIGVTAAVTLALTVGIDSSPIGYGKFTVVFWNFLQFNMFGGGSSLYGAHPWYWYFLEGLPAVLGTHLPLVIMGLYWSGEWKGSIFGWVLFYILCSSTASHKEFRFILPILPALFMYGGFCFSFIWQSKLDRKFKIFPGICVRRNTLLLSLVTLVVIPNIVASLYLSIWHQAGPICVMDHLRREIHGPTSDEKRRHEKPSIHFLTPCHATPMYSHLHMNVSVWYPDCSPQNRVKTVGSESFQLIQADTAKFVDCLYGQSLDEMKSTRCKQDSFNLGVVSNRLKLPSYMVMFQSTAAKLEFFLAKNAFVVSKSCWHSHVSGDAEESDVDNNMLVYSKTGSI